MPSRPSVVVLVLNWNNASDTIECLRSVAELAYEDFSVLVIDNGSDDDSVSQIRAAHPDVELLPLLQNLGYAEGNNAGIRHALRRRPDYLLVLNNDTLLEPQMLYLLVETLECDPSAAMAGPRIFCTDSNDTIFAEGSFVDWPRGLICHRGMSGPPDTALAIAEPVDFLAGCGVLVRASVLDRIGLLDPVYYLNYEDVEWAVRTRRLGLRVLYQPNAVLWHKVSATLGQASPANTYYMTRNSLRFFWFNADGLDRWTATASILLRTLRTILAWSLRRAYRGPAFRRQRQANILALRDFFRSRFGPMGADVRRACDRA